MDQELVIDASVGLKWFFSEEQGSRKALDILKKIKQRQIKIFVPQLFYFEVINVVKTKSESTAEEVLKVIELIFSIPAFSPKTDKKLLKKANFYAQEYELTIYDAAYLSLADIEEAVLLTADVKMAEKANLGFVKTLADF